MASTDLFRVWIRVATTYSTLVRQSKCHKDLVQHQHIEHIELHMHLIRKLVHDRILEVLFFPTDDQVADIFTKSLQK